MSSRERSSNVWLAYRSTVLFLVATPVVACSFITDTSGLAGEIAAGGTGTNTGADGGLPGSVEPAPPGTCPAAGYHCVAEAPAGWAGPLIVFDGPDSAVPSCPNTMANSLVDGHRGLIAPAAHTCSACTCGAGTAPCENFVYAGTDCYDLETLPLTAGSCLTVGASYTQARLVSSFYSGDATCAANQAVATRPEPSWQAKVRACGAPSLLRTGCESGSVCAPEAPTPFEARTCIMAEGDVACPSGPYSAKRAIAASLEDTRDCSACVCASDEAGDCQGTIELYTSTNCTGTPNSVTMPDGAVCRTNPGSVKLVNAAAKPTCKPKSGGDPIGAITAAGVTTLCCVP